MNQPKFPRLFLGPFKKALILENPDRSLDQYLSEMGIETERLDRALSEEEVVDHLSRGQHNLIFKRSRTQITRKAINATSSLYAICLCCIGDDSVDKVAAAEAGVLVLNDPISNGRSVAELVLGEMICLARRVIEADQETHSNQFNKSNEGRYELAGKNLGIFGLGNIGKQVAQLGQTLGMDVYFYDNRDVAIEVGAAMGWRPCDSLLELFRRSNVLTVHISAEDWQGRINDGVISADHFMALGTELRSGPRIFLNAARGFLHPPEALKAAVQAGVVESAFVDVYPDEPASSKDAWNNPYADTPRVHTTPHMGAATLEAQPRIAQHIATTARLLNDYGTVRDCVFQPGRSISTEAAVGNTVLAVVHSDIRGTKKAVDDAIYEAGASNLQSAHRDFPRFGIAYDLNILDRPLTEQQLEHLYQSAVKLTGDKRAIRAIRQVQVREPR